MIVTTNPKSFCKIFKRCSNLYSYSMLINILSDVVSYGCRDNRLYDKHQEQGT